MCKRRIVSTRAHHRGTTDTEIETDIWPFQTPYALDEQEKKVCVWGSGFVLAGMIDSGDGGGGGRGNTLVQWEWGEVCLWIP